MKLTVVHATSSPGKTVYYCHEGGGREHEDYYVTREEDTRSIADGMELVVQEADVVKKLEH
jgi:hypothetical protein